MNRPETWQAQVNASLNDFPYRYSHRWSEDAEQELYELLFRSLAGFRDDWFQLFFPKGLPTTAAGKANWSLRDAQGATDGAEYLATARGTACGHIFKSGESTYACKTCAVDDTCVLCTRCFEGSDHEGHQVFISISPGNSGCCDCGDKEAWRREVICSIHTERGEHSHAKQKAAQQTVYTSKTLPADLVACVRWTVARSMDYMCDVLSCSPEQMRLPKTETSIRTDELTSRLDSSVYGSSIDHDDSSPDYTLVLWNDEKHTVDDVKNQIARACKKPKSFGLRKAMEINDVGRSIVDYSTDVASLLQMASIIEQLKLTVTIRAARDTFREQMCATIIDWISDISGCAVGSDGSLLRTVVCEELLKPWHIGSEAVNKDIALHGLDDHEIEDNERSYYRVRAMFQPNVFVRENLGQDTETEDNADPDPTDFDEVDVYDYDDEDDMDVDLEQLQNAAMTDAGSMDLDFMDDDNDVTEVMEAAIAGYPAPPPPPPVPAPASRRRALSPNDSDDNDTETGRLNTDATLGGVPRTPKVKAPLKRSQKPSRHWLEKPKVFEGQHSSAPCEDLQQRVRLDWLILYDLRLWKTLRISLRHLYITTVIVIPQFKRILGLRFAGLYTPLAELYLIADREPDHSIINLSIQMLTTPTITEEVVERGNFLTNLMAILYTFLTTRQVGYPERVNSKAVLAFDAGTVTNRRMFHFFLDLRWLFQSEYIQLRMRTQPRYLLQFLDLVKLHQGICPNVRATNEHVEYENDAWISASLIIKEVDKLCRQVAMSFAPKLPTDDDTSDLVQAIRTVAQVTLINSFGFERKRFYQAEIKSLLEFHTIGPFTEQGSFYKVPKHVVQTEHMSFHHPLHYLLSWLIEDARALSWETFESLLTFTVADLKDPHNPTRNPPTPPTGLSSENMLSAILDQPLRVCAWLAQIKAGMWVRNGITLRHQANSYRSVALRDIGYQRNILMIQVGLVLMQAPNQQPGESFLAQIIDRFQMADWMKGDYAVVPGFEEAQQMDVLEDFYHLLVIALSDRGSLAAHPTEAYPSERVLEHDIAHALCFKPLSFSELSSRVTEKVSESDRFGSVLERMTDYKAPEGLSDTGSFVLKPEYIELVDPYHAHYNRNLREEAENIYRKHISKKTGEKAEDVVYEPRLLPITTGLFSDLAAFTRSELFVQVCYAALNYAQSALQGSATVAITRIDTFLHMVLHLVQSAVVEDRQSSSRPSFTTLASLECYSAQMGKKSSLIKVLLALSEAQEYASSQATIRSILRRMLQRQPDKLAELMNESARTLDRAASGSPAALSAEDKEKRKQEALARQARVMAQMKQQQNSFLMNQGIADFSDTDDDFEDVDEHMSVSQDIENKKHLWHYPTGTCILCQEVTDDRQLYGTFAFLGQSNILRTTPCDDQEFIKEVFDVPESLDRPYENRPFGFAGDNKWTVVKRSADGSINESTIQGLSRGFPQASNRIRGPVATSCGHIMHYSCFELYFSATLRRHAQQIARNHPETTEMQEFICPLCKALGNTFLPIVWKAKECLGEAKLMGVDAFESWLGEQMFEADAARSSDEKTQKLNAESIAERSRAYVASNFIPSLVSSMDDMTIDAVPTATQRRYSLRQNFNALHRLVRSARGEEMPPDGEATPTSDLFKAYTRLKETMSINSLHVQVFHDLFLTDTELINTANTLSRTLGTSISAIEIAARGSSEACGGTLLSDLSEQNVTSLRILNESFNSYLGVIMMRPGQKAGIEVKLASEQAILQSMLFTRAPGTRQRVSVDLLAPEYCMALDLFLFYNDWLSYTSPTIEEARFALRLCLWAEIVKVTVLLSEPLKLLKPDVSSEARPDERLLAAHEHLLRNVDDKFKAGGSPLWTGMPASLDEYLCKAQKLLQPYMLVFLRKALILFHVRYGLEANEINTANLGDSELSRLLRALGLPPIRDLFLIYASSEHMETLTNNWLSALYADSQRDLRAVEIAHPTIFELIGLPKNYDALTEEAIKNRCPTTGKEVTDPALCLFCGAIFCSQAVCCMGAEGQRGGCWKHMQTCGDGRIGMFINIRKCMVLFMHGRNGSFLQAPYLDRHGEPDPTLRRHHQLFLNQRRYDKLMREVWLNHGIQNVISRKLEADINPGGWETL